MRKGKYYIRIFDIYTATVIVYTLMVLLVVFFFNRQYVTTQLANDKVNILSQSKDRYDRVFSISLKLATQIMMDKNLTNYVNEGSPYYRAQLFDKLTREYAVYYDSGFNLSMLLDGEDMVISKDGLRSLDNQILDITTERDIFAREMARLEDSVPFVVLRNTEKRTFTVVHKEKMAAYNKNVFFFTTFHDAVLLPNIGEKEDFALYMDGEFITGVNNILAKHEDLPLQSGEQIFKLKNHRVYTSGSGIFGEIEYVYATQGEMPRQVFFSIGFIMLIMGGVAVFISLKGSRFLYKPVQEVLSQLNKEGSVEDEMDYIARISLDIKKTNDHLMEDLKVKDTFLRSKYLYNLGMGMVPEEDLEGLVQQFHWERFENGCTAAILEYDVLSDDIPDDMSGEFISGIRLSIHYTVKELLLEACGAEVFEINNYKYGILFPLREVDRVEAIMYEKLAELRSKYKIDFSAAIGNSCDSLREASKSLSNAMYVSEYIYSTGSKRIITQKDMERIGFSNYYFPMDVESRLLAYIRENNWENGKILLNSVLDKNLKELTLEKEALIEFKFAIVSTVKRGLQLKNKSAEEVFGEGNILYLELNMCNNNQQLYEKIEELFEKLINYSSDSDNSLIEKILDYIHRNYAKDISLLDIAEELSISTYYASRLFRAEMNLNFKEYYNNYRITKAIEMLKQDKNLKVNELSAALGFNSSESFNRVFKKYTGMSTVAYKKNMNL